MLSVEMRGCACVRAPTYLIVGLAISLVNSGKNILSILCRIWLPRHVRELEE